MRSYGKLSIKIRYSSYLMQKLTRNTYTNVLELNIQENGNRDLGMAEVSCNGQMELYMKENGI